MRRLFAYIILSASLLLTGVSCAVRDFDPEGPAVSDGTCIELTVKASDLEITKADEDGVNNLNENLIKTIDYFIFQSGHAEEDGAYISGRITEPETESRQSNETVRINIEENVFNTVLMPKPAEECDVYVIVNAPISADAYPETKSISNLRSLVVEMDVEALKQGSFVMEGLGTVKLSAEGRKAKTIASGTIDVERIAAKHTLAIFVNSSYPDNEGRTWTTQPDSMKVLFVNPVKNSAISGRYSDNMRPSVVTFSGENLHAQGRPCTLQTLGEQTYYSPAPFYSYPNEWAFNSSLEPYFLVELPVTDGTQFRSCYYKVLLKDNKLERNTWNHINLVLGILGSFSPKAPTVDLNNTTYFVFDWRDALKDLHEQDHDVEAAIREARYIMVPEHDRVMDNLETLSIAFTASHYCEIVSASAWNTKYNSSTGQFSRNDVDSDTVKSWFTVDNLNHIVEFSHALNNDIEDSDLDISPYNITIVLAHKDDHSFNETITIVQSPAIIVTPELNTANNNSQTGVGTRGDVYVNGQNRRFDDAQYNTVRQVRNDNGDLHGAEYMYVIETRVVPSGKNYIIADPRSTTPNKVTSPETDDPSRRGNVYDLFDYSNTNVNTASQKTYVTNLPGLADGPALFVEDGDYFVENGTDKRKMRYYYPTMTSLESEQFIAPKFRIASRFNSMGNIGPTWYDIVRRCATYQEAGYPAGRWRLPTKAEVSYIFALQKLQLIPEIFMHGSGDTQGYYCATDTFEFPAGQTELTFTGEIYQKTRSLRCVYDDWYWEQTDSKVNGKVEGVTQKTEGGRLPEDKYGQFTWGDMPRKGADDPEHQTYKLNMGTVSCTRGNFYLTFNWNSVSGAQGYEVRTSTNGEWVSIGTDTSYTMDGLYDDSSTYTLYVRAVGDGNYYTTSDAATGQGQLLQKTNIWSNDGRYGVSNGNIQNANGDFAYRFVRQGGWDGHSLASISQYYWDNVLKAKTFYIEVSGSSFTLSVDTGYTDGSWRGDLTPTGTDCQDIVHKVNDNTYYIEINLTKNNQAVINNMNDHNLLFFGYGFTLNRIYYFE
ncbi:MAG: hypothetical protein Q4F39_02020 [Bacteroidia bacterium]|nr:hypothetical protein [Bacteroidia bacterium]